MQIEGKLKLGILVALLTMLLVTSMPFFTAAWMAPARDDFRRSMQKSISMITLLSLVKDAESGQRGFIITGQEVFLDRYHKSLTGMVTERKELAKHLGNSPESAKMIESFDQLLALKLGELHETIQIRREKGFAAVEPIVATARGKQYMDKMNALVQQQVDAEASRRNDIKLELDWRIQVGAYASVVATIFEMGVIVVALYFLFRLLQERTKAAETIRKTARQLNESLSILERRNKEISFIAEMSKALESTFSLQEILQIVAVYCSKLLPDTTGCLYLFRNSRDVLEIAGKWGAPREFVETIVPQDCWALRRGQPHRAADASDLCCPHYGGESHQHAGHICIPLMAQGEVLGLIFIESSHAQQTHERHVDNAMQDLAVAVSEQIALGLSNAKLREVLQQQSIIDPLTGLFNRRYMDETLRRELSRAARKSGCLSCVMLDVDHFKQINDTYGHDAGDLVLRSIADAIREGVREGDLVCRYGGEELVLIFPECGKDDALVRTEKIRASIESLQIKQKNQTINKISASFGVATFPQDGLDAEKLLQAADHAMFSAKKSGRNMVVAAC